MIDGDFVLILLFSAAFHSHEPFTSMLTLTLGTLIYHLCKKLPHKRSVVQAQLGDTALILLLPKAFSCL